MLVEYIKTALALPLYKSCCIINQSSDTSSFAKCSEGLAEPTYNPSFCEQNTNRFAIASKQDQKNKFSNNLSKSYHDTGLSTQNDPESIKLLSESCCDDKWVSNSKPKIYANTRSNPDQITKLAEKNGQKKTFGQKSLTTKSPNGPPHKITSLYLSSTVENCNNEERPEKIQDSSLPLISQSMYEPREVWNSHPFSTLKGKSARFQRDNNAKSTLSSSQTLDIKNQSTEKMPFFLRFFDYPTLDAFQKAGIKINEFKSSASGKALAFDLILAPPTSPKCVVRKDLSLTDTTNNRDYMSNSTCHVLSAADDCNVRINADVSQIMSQSYTQGCNASSPKLTRDDIENKLKSAEHKRKTLESQYKEQWKIKEEKIKELAQVQRQASLRAKDRHSQNMKEKEEKRASQLRALQEKLILHEQHVMDVCLASENFGRMVKEKLDKKIKTAEEKRSSVINGLLDRLKEHEARVEEVKRVNEEMRQEMDSKMKIKMQNAIANREEMLASIKLKIKEHVDHVKEVRNSLGKSPRNASLTTSMSSPTSQAPNLVY